MDSTLIHVGENHFLETLLTIALLSILIELNFSPSSIWLSFIIKIKVSRTIKVAGVLVFALFSLIRCSESDDNYNSLRSANLFVQQINSSLSIDSLKLGYAGEIFLNPENDQPLAQEYSIVGSKGQTCGYILASTTTQLPPILEFSIDGELLSKQLRKRTRDSIQVNSIYWLSSTLILGVDSSYRVIAKFGVPDLDSVENISYKKLNDMERLRYLSKKILTPYMKKQDSEQWEELYYPAVSKKKTGDLDKINPPDKDYSIYTIEGHNHVPSLDQIPAHTGANNTDHLSGCAAVAWATIIGYHDINFTPETLRGSQRNNGGWGLSNSFGAEPRWGTYLNRVIMDLHDKLETYEDHDGEGWTYDSNIPKGFNYLRENLWMEYAGREEENYPDSEVIKLVYKKISGQGITYGGGRPVLVKTPGHLSVAIGFWYNHTNDDIDRHWIEIETGWASRRFIKSDHLQKCWFFSHLNPNSNSKKTYNIVSSKTPVVVTTFAPNDQVAPNNLRKLVWVFYLDQDGTINYLKGQGTFPSSISTSLGVKSLYPPAVHSTGERLFLAYVDPNKTIKLKYWNVKEDIWNDIPFPNLMSDIRPAICGDFQKWLTVGFQNSENGLQLIANNRIEPGRISAWPSSFATTTNGYWTNCGLLETNHGISFVQSNGYNHLFAFDRSSRRLIVRTSLPDNSGTTYFGDTYDLNSSNPPFDFTLYNKTLWIVTNEYRTYITRLNLPYISTSTGRGWYPTNPNAYLDWTDYVGTFEQSAENTTISFRETELGKHPVALMCWIGVGNNKINLRVLSIDTRIHGINNQEYP